MRNLSLLLVVAMLLTISPQQAEAVIYKYVDESGRTVFVDDAGKIPPRYRQATSAIKEQKDLQPANAEQTEESAGSVEAGDEAVSEVPALPMVDFASQAEAKKHAADQEKRRAYTTPVMVRGNRVLVPVEVAVGGNLGHLNLLIDPDATEMVIHRRALSGLQLPAGEKLDVSMPGGRTLPAEKVMFSYIEVGPFREQNATAMIIDPQGPDYPYDGRLGKEFLQDHPYEVDTKNEQLFWKIID